MASMSLLRACRRGLLAVSLVIAGMAAPARAVVLDFEGIVIPDDTILPFAGPYSEDGYTLTPVDIPTGFSSGFNAIGPNAGLFFAGSKSLAVFGNSRITLTPDDGTPFDLLSIDLARLFAGDTPTGVPPSSFPVVTFTGQKAGGGTVTQTFTVDREEHLFETFLFSTDFTNLASVSWTQPQIQTPDPDNPGRFLGLHQFDNITVTPTVIPEPASLCLLGVGMVLAGLVHGRRPRRVTSFGLGTADARQVG